MLWVEVRSDGLQRCCDRLVGLFKHWPNGPSYSYLTNQVDIPRERQRALMQYIAILKQTLSNVCKGYCCRVPDTAAYSPGIVHVL
jgi:hypothetical protein